MLQKQPLPQRIRIKNRYLIGIQKQFYNQVISLIITLVVQVKSVTGAFTTKYFHLLGLILYSSSSFQRQRFRDFKTNFKGIRLVKGVKLIYTNSLIYSIYSIKYVLQILQLVVLLLITFSKLLTYSYNNKAYTVGYSAGKSLINPEIGERKLQGISSRRGVEDISVSSRKELKAIRRRRKRVLTPIENHKLQEISFRRGVEEIAISSYRGVKAIQEQEVQFLQGSRRYSYYIQERNLQGICSIIEDVANSFYKGVKAV